MMMMMMLAKTGAAVALVMFGMLLIPKIDAYSVVTTTGATNNALCLKSSRCSSSSLVVPMTVSADGDADCSNSNSHSQILQPPATLLSSRRYALLSIVGSAAGATAFLVSQPPAVATAAEEDSNNNKSIDAAAANAAFRYELRDRNMNRDAIIREDYWYMLGKNPPRLLAGPLRGDDPQWNAFGTCTTSTDAATGAVTGNSCTYVSLSLRIPAYSKYAFAIAYGAKQYAQLGRLLHDIAENQNIGNKNTEDLWAEAASFVQTKPGNVPPAVVDAELKLVLLATALLTSPNFPQPGRELLVARYYANEVHFAHGEILRAVLGGGGGEPQPQEGERNLQRAMAAWEFGRDSWNSYFQVVNRSIVPKVGEPFQAIAL